LKNETLESSVGSMMTAAFNAPYSYNFCWLDRPMIQYSQDIVAMQEVLGLIHRESVFS